MKNKHLVLLFLLVLIIGLLSRHLPVRYRSFFQSELIRVDTAEITKCVLLAPGQPELALERSENGWAVDQDGRVAPVAQEDMAPLLATLAGIHSFRRVKTSRPDTLGFTTDKLLRVRVFDQNRLVEYFELGNEVLEEDQPLTYLQLPLHNGVYLVPGHLRQIFARSLDDFRPGILVQVSTDAIRRIGISSGPADTLVVFDKNDSLQRWISRNRRFSLRDDSVQHWMGLFKRLNNSPFADNFDESQAHETRVATLLLETADSIRLTLQFYAFKPPNLPEDLSDLRRHRVRALPVYVMHSSDNPLNYFAATDTNLVHFLCYGLWQPPLPGKK